MIKVTVGEQKTQSEKPFPKLMNGKNHELIVLMIKPYEGIVLKGSCFYEIGYNSVTWDMESFTDYNEPITLQNA